MKFQLVSAQSTQSAQSTSLRSNSHFFCKENSRLCSSPLRNSVASAASDIYLVARSSERTHSAVEKGIFEKTRGELMQDYCPLLFPLAKKLYCQEMAALVKFHMTIHFVKLLVCTIIIQMLPESNLVACHSCMTDTRR